MSEPRIRTRMRVLAMLVAFMFAALSARLWFLQVLASDSFAKQADQNQVRLVPLAPLRGEVLDRRGRVLIGNRSSTIITVDRQELNGQEEQVLFRLSSLLKVPVKDLVSRLDSVKYLPYQPVPVAEDVTKDVVFYIEEHRALFPGVSYQVGSVRSYPFGSLAAQVLGWTGEVSDAQLQEPQFKGYRPGSIVGKAGVEAQYQQALYGTDGVREIQVNAQGQVLDQNFGGQAAVPGSNVVLSIDTGIQQLAEESLATGIDVAHHTIDGVSGKPLRAPGGAVIVLDPKTGSVLAMASNPTLQPGDLHRRAEHQGGPHPRPVREVPGHPQPAAAQPGHPGPVSGGLGVQAVRRRRRAPRGIRQDERAVQLPLRLVGARGPDAPHLPQLVVPWTTATCRWPRR